MRIVNSLTVILIAILTILYLCEPSLQCHNNVTTRYKLPTIIYTIVYLVIGILFMVCGLKMNSITKAHYEKFYAENGNFIWYATFLLSVPIILRGINSFLLLFAWWEDLYFRHWVEMSTFFILVFNLLPLITQLSSLYFGARYYFS
jgi:hypothetical protein